MKILAINPGSTSTKIAVYDDEQVLMTKNIVHPAGELRRFKEGMDQLEFRKQLIIDELKAAGIPMSFDAIIGRGGLAKPVEGGVYDVTEHMIDDIRNMKDHRHACNLGSIIARELALEIPGCRSMMADPGSVDELLDEVRISGWPELERICIWHALNQRSIARRFAKEHATTYDKLNLIMCHLGGGISIAAHRQGKAVDANNALDGEGPFSPERSGSLPVAALIKLCFSGKYTEAELLARVAGRGGLLAHLGTNDVRVILQRIADGDRHAEKILNAMLFHTAKSIVAEGAVLCGKVDAIILTGGLVYSDYVVSRLRERIEFLAPVYCYPGEDEMEALAMNALAVLRGEFTTKDYDKTTTL